MFLYGLKLLIHAQIQRRLEPPLEQENMSNYLAQFYVDIFTYPCNSLNFD